MDKSVFKSFVILSLIVGIIFGVLSPVPILGTIVLLALLFLSAPLVMIYLIMDGKFDLETIKDSIVYGAIAGMFANISFAFTYAIITAIIYAITQYSSNLLLTTMIINSPIWLLIVVILFMGVLTATTNAFSGLATYYAINLIRDIYEKKHNNSNNNFKL